MRQVDTLCVCVHVCFKGSDGVASSSGVRTARLSAFLHTVRGQLMLN